MKWEGTFKKFVNSILLVIGKQEAGLVENKIKSEFVLVYFLFQNKPMRQDSFEMCIL